MGELTLRQTKIGRQVFTPDIIDDLRNNIALHPAQSCIAHVDRALCLNPLRNQHPTFNAPWANFIRVQFVRGNSLFAITERGGDSWIVIEMDHPILPGSGKLGTRIFPVPKRGGSHATRLEI
jgi:hypothetical protein